MYIISITVELFAMGVRGLFKFLRKRCPRAFVSSHRDIYRITKDKYVAVDAQIHCTRLANASKTTDHDALASVVTNFVQELHSRYGIRHTYLISDGGLKHAKRWEKARREAQRSADKKRLDDKRADLTRMEEQAIVHADDALVESRFTSGITEASVVAPAVTASGFLLEQDTTQAQTMSALDIKRRVHHERKAALHSSIQKHEERIKIVLRHRDVDSICTKVAQSFPGATFFASPGEAEYYCAGFVHNGVADVVVSNDGDVVPLGAPYTLMFIPGRAPELLDTSVVTEDLGIDMDQLRTMCVVAGTDFAPYIKRAGIATAYKRVKTHKTLVQLLKTWTTKLPCKDYVPPDPVQKDRTVADGSVVSYYHCPDCAQDFPTQPLFVAHVADVCFPTTVTQAMTEADAIFRSAWETYDLETEPYVE